MKDWKYLSTYAPGSVVKLGDFEMVVLEQLGNKTALILKDLYCEKCEFGASNNFAGSIVDEMCQEFAQKLAVTVGWENIVPHKVDLSFYDGSKGYGVIKRRASLLTARLYEKFSRVLSEYNPGCPDFLANKPGKFWWLATPTSVFGCDDRYLKCVWPTGGIRESSGFECSGSHAVRPYCHLKSNVVVVE